MPVEVTPIASRLRLRLQTDIDEEGEPVLRTRTYSNIKSTTENEELFAVAQEFVGLQKNPVEGVYRLDEVEMEVV